MTPRLRGDPVSVVQQLRLDPAAVLDLRELRYQWFDHVLKAAALPPLLRAPVNYQLAGSDEWRHAAALADMESSKMRFYLSAKTSRGGHHLLQDSSSDKNSIEQSMSFTDRSDADWTAPASLVTQSPDLRNGILFESAPLKRATDLAGAFSGHLEFTVNKMDVDLSLSVYERLASGVYVRVMSPRVPVQGELCSRPRSPAPAERG